MQTWRRQTIIVGICFAVVMLVKFYFEHDFAGGGDASQASPQIPHEEVTGSGGQNSQEPRDTVVTLEKDP